MEECENFEKASGAGRLPLGINCNRCNASSLNYDALFRIGILKEKGAKIRIMLLFWPHSLYYVNVLLWDFDFIFFCLPQQQHFNLYGTTIDHVFYYIVQRHVVLLLLLIFLFVVCLCMLLLLIAASYIIILYYVYNIFLACLDVHQPNAHTFFIHRHLQYMQQTTKSQEHV